MRDEMGFSPLEIFGLVHGVKPISRLAVNLESPEFEHGFERFKRKCEELGLYWKLKRYKKLRGFETGVDVLYVSRKPETIERLIEAEAAHDHERMGRIFNFPRCCIDSFCIRDSHSRQHLPLEIYSNSRKPFPFYNNFLYYTFTYFQPSSSAEQQCLKRIKSKCLYFIYHLPCSFNCRESIKMGKNASQF